MAVLDLPTLVIFPLLMAFAAASDILTMTIANRVSILLVGGYIGLALLAGVPVAAIGLDHLVCGAAVLLLTFGLFAFGWIGGGDAKLAAATAVWLGWPNLADYGLLASVLGAGLTFAILWFRRFGLPPRLEAAAWLARLHHKDNGVPYGVALATAGLVLYPQSQIWQVVAAV